MDTKETPTPASTTAPAPENAAPQSAKLVEAQKHYNTGMCLLLGQGGEADEPTGLKLVAQAAQMGLEQAIFELAQYYHVMGQHDYVSGMFAGLEELAAKGDEDAAAWLKLWKTEARSLSGQ